jgi:hypothetical protein
MLFITHHATTVLARYLCSVAHEVSVCMHTAIKCLLPLCQKYWHQLWYWTRPHNKQTLAEKAPGKYMNNSMWVKRHHRQSNSHVALCPNAGHHHWNRLVGCWVSRDLQHENHKHKPYGKSPSQRKCTHTRLIIYATGFQTIGNKSFWSGSCGINWTMFFCTSICLSALIDTNQLL